MQKRFILFVVAAVLAGGLMIAGPAAATEKNPAHETVVFYVR